MALFKQFERYFFSLNEHIKRNNQNKSEQVGLDPVQVTHARVDSRRLELQRMF